MNYLQSLYPKAANRAEVEGQLTEQGIRNSPNASEELESLEDAGKIESREISTPDGDVRYYRATEAGTVEHRAAEAETVEHRATEAGTVEHRATEAGTVEGEGP